MANDTISQLEINGVTYDILDANTKDTVDQLSQRVTSLESSVGRVYIEPKVTTLSFQNTDDLFGIRIFGDENRQLLIGDFGIEWRDRNNGGNTVIWRK